MATLLLRLAGPLQSWGCEAKFETRRTLKFPTKSGVIGLIAAALGYSRTDSLERLTELKFGIRVDREGKMIRDYHIAKGKKDKETYITNRYYLADATFLVGLEGNEELLSDIEDAIKHPAFPLFLGRRSCVPTMPIVLGFREGTLLETLKKEPWLISDFIKKKSIETDVGKLRIITDSNNNDPESSLCDVPVSFSPIHRKYTWREVCDYGYVDMTVDGNPTEHDVFSELEVL